MKSFAEQAGRLGQYRLQTQPDPYRPVKDYFRCQVKNMETRMLPLLNGWHVHEGENLVVYPDGVTAGSLKAALQNCPEMVKPYLFQLGEQEQDDLTRANEETFTDGIFIYVPDNVKAELPFQIVSLINSQDNLLVQNHNVIHVGKNAELSVIQCDDSIRYYNTFINIVTEINLAENARLHYYKTENKEADSVLFNHLYVNQQTGSLFRSNAITFNAGYVYNNIHVNLNEPFAEADLYGLYLVDKRQQCSNCIKVSHNATDCKSLQLYKGIMDDKAEACFAGHVIVKPHAQRTFACQTNRNILLTEKAEINTKPFLEIYADDVQCSHGATVGQLDEDALFYLRSRGVSKQSARHLLMFAFANEICQHVEIQSLKEKLSDMVQRRLDGELTICDQCLLHDAEQTGLIFPIDPSKI